MCARRAFSSVGRPTASQADQTTTTTTRREATPMERSMAAGRTAQAARRGQSATIRLSSVCAAAAIRAELNCRRQPPPPPSNSKKTSSPVVVVVPVSCPTVRAPAHSQCLFHGGGGGGHTNSLDASLEALPLLLAFGWPKCAALCGNAQAVSRKQRSTAGCVRRALVVALAGGGRSLSLSISLSGCVPFKCNSSAAGRPAVRV